MQQSDAMRSTQRLSLSVESLEPRVLLDAGATGQLPLPLRIGQTFLVDDFDNKITLTDMGFNYCAGNMGAVNGPPDGPTVLSYSPESSALQGGSLRFAFDFAGQDYWSFAGAFMSLFGLTDTYVSLDGSGEQPEATTPFPGYCLDMENLYGDLGLWAGRSAEELRFDYWVGSGTGIILKVELRDEAGEDVFARVELSDTEAGWQTVSLTMPEDFDRSADGDVTDFNWHEVSLLSLIVERNHDADGVHNPDSGVFLVDNVAVVDLDGAYPDFEAAAYFDGTLRPEYVEAFLEHVRATSMLYFLDFASTDPRTGGIIQDRSAFADLMTVGGAGFQLTSYVIASERGYLSRGEAASRTHAVLQHLYEAPQSAERVGAAGYQGFFYHFLGIDGLRKQNFDFSETEPDESLNTVEVSTIDTALAICGAITAQQYFDADDPVEAEIRSMADSIYRRVDWAWMLDADTNQFYLGWKPNETRDDESGLYGRFLLDDAEGLGQYASKEVDGTEVGATLDYYTDEGLLVALLAVASPEAAHRVDPSVFYAMVRDDAGGGFVRTYPGSLFTYEFASVWLDTSSLGPDGHPDQPLDYFENTRLAIAATRQYAMDNPWGRATWAGGGGATRWGLSACEGPFDSYFADAAPPAALANGGGPVSPIVLEGEDGVVLAGSGTAKLRSNASGQRTMLLYDGAQLSLAFETSAALECDVIVRYSNDNYPPPGETIEVSLDGAVLGVFEAADTGDWGHGWNVFVTSQVASGLEVAPGEHELVIGVSGGDGYGVEIDVVDMPGLPVYRPLEVGTATVYGAGSSIVHAPAEAIAALWEAQGLGLLHPRFGFADAFNLGVADALVTAGAPGDVLRAEGPWANFTGFAIDHGPMLAMIDNYLEGQFVPQVFMSHPAISEALGSLFPSYNPEEPGLRLIKQEEQNGITVSFYLAPGMAEVDPANIGVTFGWRGSVSSISLSGAQPMEGLGVVVCGATRVSRISDSRTAALGDLAFIASDSPIRSIQLGSGIAGYDVNGSSLGGIDFAEDIDGDGETDDLTAIYCGENVGRVRLGGDIGGDIWIGGQSYFGTSLSSMTTVNGNLHGELWAPGRIGWVTVGGDLAGALAGERLSSLRVSGLFHAGSMVTVSGRVGTLSLASYETENGGAPFGAFAGGYWRLTVGGTWLSPRSLPYVDGDFCIEVVQ
jgi:hypothetical protein